LAVYSRLPYQRIDLIALLAIPGVRRLADQVANLGAWLVTLGALGLFGISLLDSALIPLPSGPDVVMILLSSLKPAWMPLYAAAATAGSTLGSTFLYLVARRAGQRALRRVSPEKRERIEGLLGRYDMLAVIVPAILPPPFPFKAFVLSAGVFKLKIERFVAAVLIGRAVRFLIEGFLALEFGEDARRIIERHGIKVLAAVGLLFAISFGLKFYRVRSRTPIPATADEAQVSGNDL
jgi:membrane protein YqaA with SNARE-associated domain